MAARRCLYFAYGSNLSSWRININVPSAVFHSVGRLDGYALTFRSLIREPRSGPWRGAVATVVPEKDAVCCGVVWSISEDEVSPLDAQEHGYKPIEIQVHTDESDATLSCRAYIQQDISDYDSSVDMPSPAYLQCIVNGAIEHKLPQDYIERLQKIEHNGYNGPVAVTPSN